MAVTRGKGQLRDVARQLLRRTPLRVKLISAVLGLLAVALTIISVASVYVLRDYLQSRADRQVSVSFFRSMGLLGGQPYVGNAPGGALGAAFPYVAEILGARGQVVTETGMARPSPNGPDVPTDPAWLKTNGRRLVTVPSLSGTDNWRVITQRVNYRVLDPFTGQTSNGAGTLVVGADLGDINGTIRQLTVIDLVVSGFVVLGLAIAGVAIVRASLRPLGEIEVTAERIAAGDLSRRVPDHDPRTEIGRLGRSLNSMLSQIEFAFHVRSESEAAARRSEERMRQFVADASHELRTPLTAIRGFAEYYRQRANPSNEAAAGQHADQYQAGAMIPARPVASAHSDEPPAMTDLGWIMHRVEQESTRMGGLVDDLLLLARLDQQRPVDQDPVDLLALAADAIRDARMMSPDRQIHLTIGTGTAFLILGDEARLRQVINNLIGNGVTHTPDGTQIDVRLLPGTIGSAPGVALEVADQGPGLKADQADRVFERFYRADLARARKTGGSGLGLSIVAALVAAHGGTVSLDTAPGHGATFRVMLPLAPEVLASDHDHDRRDQ